MKVKAIHGKSFLPFFQKILLAFGWGHLVSKKAFKKNIFASKIDLS
jgi:hypothetical protein